MRKFDVALLVPIIFFAGVPRGSGAPLVPPDVSLNEYGEAGYIWSGYTTKHPGQPIGWKPQEGDLIFFTSSDRAQTITYAIGRTTHPFHVALVVRRSNGELGVVESGGGGNMAVSFRPVLARFGIYDLVKEKRFAWVRRVRQPLTAEQSQLMTAYAEAQVGKPFSSFGRLLMFWLPGHPSPKTTADQPKWFCSEIVVALLQESGVFAKNQFRPGSTTPRELFTDCLWNDISDRYHAPLPWSLTLSQPPVPGPKCAPYNARE